MNFYQKRLNKLRRHFYVFNRHLTPSKIINIAKSEANFRLNKKVVNSKPYALKIETTVLCNLRCPGCFRTENALSSEEKFMTLEQYKKIIDPLAPYLLEISLYDQGEPLLHPKVFEFLEYNSQKNIGTIVSSNFAMKLSDEKLEKLIKSGLDYLIVAIDGIKQETYEKYRVGGKLETLLDNLKRLIAIKKKLNSKRPYVEWQMVDFDWNKEEQPEAEKIAKEIGCDFFKTVVNGYTLNCNESHRRTKRCPVLWSTFTVEFDSSVSACYVNDDETLYVGDLKKQSVLEVWNSKEYQFLRETHNNKEEGAKPSFCNRCEMFDK